MENKKLRVLVADDEYWIRENLRTVIDWDALGLELLPMATDGEDALAKMEKNPADIVITDINMPYLSGVELMEQLKSRWPGTAILVLSGYSDFEYVHKALLLGALDYVLKPLNRSKLMEAIARATEHVLALTRRRRERSEEQARLNLAASMVLDREFSQWLHDARHQDKLQSVEASLFDYEAAFSSYRVVLVRLPGFMQHLGEGELPRSAAEAVYKIKTALSSLVLTGNKLVIHDLYHANHFLLITEMDEDALRRLLPDTLCQLGALSLVQPRAMVSGSYFSFRDLRRAYDEVRRCLSSMKCGGDMEIGFSASAQVQPMVQRISADTVHQLEHAARAQQRERFERLLEHTGIYRCREESWTVMELMHSVNCVTWILQHLTEDSRSDAQRAAMDNLQELLLSAVDGMELDQLGSLFAQLMDEYFIPAGSDGGSDGMRRTVQRVRAYIDAHYDEAISLSTLAARFHVDDSYLSRMFKQQVGSNLMLYLAKTRIEQAKRLLIQKDMSITDVAQLVGYDDYAYFSRVFRRMEGKSPRAYREEEIK
ncbi:MAG: response regulator [Clostridia bacterium]|nr:response regulator [Clostridia bacterium]